MLILGDNYFKKTKLSYHSSTKYIMAANFRLDDILAKGVSSKDIKDHIRLKGKFVRLKDDVSFITIADYTFSDGEQGLLIYIDKNSAIEKAFKALKLKKEYVKTLITGSVVFKDENGNENLEFTKNTGKGKTKLAEKLMKKNAWIKQAAFNCNFVVIENESEGDSEGDEQEELETAPQAAAVDTASTSKINKDELNAAAIALKDKWDILSVTYTELQKDKANKGLLMRVKSLVQEFLTSYEEAPAMVKPSMAKIYANVQTMATNLSVSANSTTQAATISPEKAKAIEVNTKIKTALDTLLRDINLEAIYKEAVA